jgi:hypothetical protein
MGLYKLTKDTVSTIRVDAKGIQEALEDGYVFDGEVVEKDGGYEVTNPAPAILGEIKAKREKRPRAATIIAEGAEPTEPTEGDPGTGEGAEPDGAAEGEEGDK